MGAPNAIECGGSSGLLDPLFALAKVAELADALDLGSSGPKPWGFESPLSHQGQKNLEFGIKNAAIVDENHSKFQILMLLNYEDLSPVKKSVEVEIPADLISNEAKRVTTEFTRQAKLPGFRPN